MIFINYNKIYYYFIVVIILFILEGILFSLFISFDLEDFWRFVKSKEVLEE